MTELPREDVFCPACPNPDTAFRLEDVGIKFTTEGDPYAGGARVTASRPAWEPVMLDHLRSRIDDDKHRRLYDQCITHLMEAGVSAEESAQQEVQGAVDMVRRSLDDALHRGRL